MKELTLTFPDDLAQLLNVPSDDLPAHLRLMAVLKIFELGQISAGKAAELLGISKLEFYEVCSRNHISPFNYADDEVEAQLLHDIEAAGGRIP